MNKITFIMLLLLAGCSSTSSTTWVWHKEDMSNFAEDERACEKEAQKSYERIEPLREKKHKRYDELASKHPIGSLERALVEFRRGEAIRGHNYRQYERKRDTRLRCLKRRGYTLLQKES